MRRNGKVKPDRDGSDSPRAASENTPEPFRRNRRTADAARGALPSEPGLTGPNGREEPWLRHGKPQVRGPVPNPDPWNRQAEGEAPPEPIRKPDGTGRLTRHVASASRPGDAEAGRRPAAAIGGRKFRESNRRTLCDDIVRRPLLEDDGPDATSITMRGNSTVPMLRHRSGRGAP